MYDTRRKSTGRGDIDSNFTFCVKLFRQRFDEITLRVYCMRPSMQQGRNPENIVSSKKHSKLTTCNVPKIGLNYGTVHVILMTY